MPFGTCIDVETYRNKLENHIIHLSLEFYTAYFKTNYDKKGDLIMSQIRSILCTPCNFIW